MRSAINASFVATALLLSSSCANILGIDETVARGRSFACVGNSVPPVGNGTAITIPAVIRDIATQFPVEGLQVTRCLTRLQQNCDVASAVLSDANGLVSIPVTSGFTGYLKIEDIGGNGSGTDRVTYLWYFSQPIVTTRATPFPIQSMTRDFRAMYLYDPVNAPHDPSRGEIAINASDCGDFDAPDIHYVLPNAASSTADTHPFYIQNGFLTISSVSSDEFTDASGIGGFIGVSLGQVPVRAEDRSGRLIASDTLLVQPDALTTVRLLAE